LRKELKMPYPGINKENWSRLDRCVTKVIAGSDFRKRYASRIKKVGTKSLAIAICRKALKV